MSTSTPISTLFRFNNNRLSSSIFDGNSNPQKMPRSSAGILSSLGPDGFWDRNTGGKRGPIDPLQQDNSKKQALYPFPLALEKNILTNQTPHVQYINATHIVVPQRMPNSEDSAVSWIDVAKCVHAGDIVWALRCPPPMVNAQFASRLTRKTQYNYTCGVNLAIVNYVLFRLQSFFHVFGGFCCNVNELEVIAQNHYTPAAGTTAAFVDLGGAANEYRTELRYIFQKFRNKGTKRSDMWEKWLDFISESDDLRLKKLLAWGMEDATYKSDSACFLESWWDDIMVDTGLLNILATGTMALNTKISVGNALVNIFLTRVESFLWDFLKSNCNMLGVFIGSDQQGGAHQEESNPATSWPNDFVGTIQVTGKSRRLSNIWNREAGFSSGHSLGFKLTRLNIEGRSVEFQLSSNPSTATTIKTCDTGTLFPLGVYSVLTPSLSQDENSFQQKIGIQSKICPDTFWRFACANQMSKQMNVPSTSQVLALNAIAMGGCPPIEVIMRRTFYDHRKLAEYWAKVDLSNYFSASPPVFKSIVRPSYAAVEAPSADVASEPTVEVTEAATVPFEPKKTSGKKKFDKKDLV